tara:strand:+ start:1520 stop:1774 length:255 start_codon:yes stop_codon:yes gene_type:complete
MVARSTNLLISDEKYKISKEVPPATIIKNKFLVFFLVNTKPEHLLRTFGNASRHVMVVLNIALKADKRIKFLAASPKDEYSSAS